MEFTVKNIMLLMSVVATALSAGIFYAWVTTVIPGTKKIPDQAYLETMQSINREILNVGFFFVFFGALLFLLCSTYLQYKLEVNTAFYLTFAAAFVYAAGTIGVTMLGNVPLNNMVEALDLSSFSAQDYKNARLAYEVKWNNFNLVRTLASLASFVLILMAFIRN